jgi:hypothetical protein
LDQLRFKINPVAPTKHGMDHARNQINIGLRMVIAKFEVEAILQLAKISLS